VGAQRFCDAARELTLPVAHKPGMKQNTWRAALSIAGLALAVLGTAPTAAATPVAVVHIKNFAFAPATLTIVAGQIVRFVNDDQDAHTVTSTTKTFNSGGLDTGDAWTYVFSKPGTFAYFCAMHPYMHGSIVVRAEKDGTK
jgi:plastocyanin